MSTPTPDTSIRMEPMRHYTPLDVNIRALLFSNPEERRDAVAAIDGWEEAQATIVRLKKELVGKRREIERLEALAYRCMGHQGVLAGCPCCSTDKIERLMGERQNVLRRLGAVIHAAGGSIDVSMLDYTRDYFIQRTPTAFGTHFEARAMPEEENHD